MKLAGVRSKNLAVALVLMATAFQADADALLGLSVPDLIALTRFGSQAYGGAGGDDSVASPDGAHVAVVVQKGVLRDNTREFSLLLFSTLQPAAPKVLARLVTGSNLAAISQVTWLSNRTVAFMGENGATPPQVYAVEIDRANLVALTRAGLPVSAFKATPSGAVIVYVTEDAPADTSGFAALRAHGFAVPDTMPVSEIIAGKWGPLIPSAVKPNVVHVVKNGSESSVPLPDPAAFGECSAQGEGAVSGFLLSPAGDSALLLCYPPTVPATWSQYEEKEFRRNLTAGANYPWWVLLDLRSGQARPLTGAAAMNFSPAPQWSPDGRSIVVTNELLPLEGVDDAERAARASKRMTAEIDVGSGAVRAVADRDDPAPTTAPAMPKIEVQEGLNQPWRLVTVDPRSRKKRVIYAPNTELLSRRRLARQTVVRWTTPTGAEAIAGLYWPLDYRPGKKYPLVIQTHGFEEEKFSPDGYSTTGYAAQPLAAAGVMVVQAHKCIKDCDTPRRQVLREGQRVLDGWESLIDDLDRRGLIERNKVALQGYSRSCFHEFYFLTHSSYPIAAMTCADGIDLSYLQYLIFTPASRAFVGEFAHANGGEPFGANLRTWLERAPGFRLDRIHAPVQLTALGDGSSLLQEWEPFAGLIMQGKPVELIYIPDAAHNIVRPWERMTSQQGAVDWFRFWLQGHERTEPVAEAQETRQGLAGQYGRWSRMAKEWRERRLDEQLKHSNETQ